MSEGADAALRLRMSRSLGALSCRTLTWNASGAKRSRGISTWCSMARLQTCIFLSRTQTPFASGHTYCRDVKILCGCNHEVNGRRAVVTHLMSMKCRLPVGASKIYPHANFKSESA